MSIKAEISLKNDTNEDIKISIPKGQIFENKQVGSGFQNVAAARHYDLIVPANSRISVNIDVYCMNQGLSYPKSVPGRVTIYKIASQFSTQDDLWDLMSKPAS